MKKIRKEADIHYMNLETEEKEWRKKESVRELQQKRNWN